MVKSSMTVGIRPMFKLIWNSWWRNKERFLILIAGALIVSIGLSYLVGITQASNATIVDELNKRWKSSYHIVVRSPDARSVTEDKNLLEPNYLSGLSGGISLDQWNKIKDLEEVEVAAPIAMMGYVLNDTTLQEVNYTEPGIYRMTMIEKMNTGAETVIDEASTYFTVGPWEPTEGQGQEYGASVMRGPRELTYGTHVLLAGIDPEAEAALVGLNNAIIDTETSGYFTDWDLPNKYLIDEERNIVETQIPIIVSNQEFAEGEISYSFEKLDIPFEADPITTMEQVKENGGADYLSTIDGEKLDEFIFTTKEAHKQIVKQIVNPTYETGEYKSTDNNFGWIWLKPTSVNYREVTSPYGDRWPFTYEVEPFMVKDSPLPIDHAYRPVSLFSKDSSGWPRVKMDPIGVFDPSKLAISKDPLTELPMETYFPSRAMWVLDKDEEPINPPTEMKPLNNPYGFLTKPPLMLTTIDAAAEVLGDEVISAIRIKVDGVEELNEESEIILQSVAKKIEEKTGLITDITLGSSPQPALTHIPGIGEDDSIGWIEQPWIKIGSSFSIFAESKVGMSGVIGSVIIVAIVYVFSSNIIMMYARKKEFAVLLSVGWRPNQLMKLLFVEASLVGLFVTIMSWFILGLIYVIYDVETSLVRILLIGLFGLAIYLLGALIPGLLVRKISPYETIKTGEIAKQKRFLRTKTVLSMSFNNILTKWKRSILSIIAIALPTSLLIFFLFITLRLRGVMYTTRLGDFVAMEVGPMHYIAMGVAISIAILTTAEIIWQNVSERQPELAVLKALGWQNKTVRKMVWFEGALCGLFAGIIGIALAFMMIWFMYGEFPESQIPFFAATIAIPVITGIIGAILPAEKAVKIEPYQGMNGGYGQSKKTEKSFVYAFSIAGVCLFFGTSILLSQAIPDVEKTSEVSSQEQPSVEGTSGEVRDYVEADNSKDVIIEETTENIPGAWKTIELGEYAFNSYRKLFFGQPIPTPENVDLSSVEEGMEVVTIPISFETDFSGGDNINPFMFLLMSSSGETIKPYNMTIVENTGWKSGRINAGDKVTFANTYVFPKWEKGWRIRFKNWSFEGNRYIDVMFPPSFE
jgi:hypothetical protein